MREVPSTGWRRLPKRELSRAYWIGLRMKLFFNGRPSAVKYSPLPSRSKRTAVNGLPLAVNTAAVTGPLRISSPSRQVCSTTTLKRSPWEIGRASCRESEEEAVAGDRQQREKHHEDAHAR